MNRLRILPWLLILAGWSAAPGAAPAGPDLLRFTNGDQLHGKFIGIKEGPLAVWQREDLTAPGEFKTSQIHQIVLRSARPAKALESISNVRLLRGDQVPGEITGLDAEHVTVTTNYAGVLRIPRKQVAMLAPNPLGGRVCYHGPFVEDDWKMVHPSFPDGLPAATDAGKGAESGEQPGRWTFSGSAWYWQNKLPGTALLRESAMPDRAVLRFDLAWKNQLSFAIAVHADFAKVKPTPEPEGKEDGKNERKQDKRLIRPFSPGDPSGLPRLFGNSSVIQIYSNYMMLIRTHVDENGKPSFERTPMNQEGLRLGDKNHATVEIRSSRSTGQIALFINDEFITQWEGVKPEPDGEIAKPDSLATGFGFLSQGIDGIVRITDITVTEWNGMPDSARSLRVKDQDIVLMANGTDRFAGRVEGIDPDHKLHFTSKLGKFQFPLEEVAEVRFAQNHLATPPDDPPNQLTVYFSPAGSISGRPVASDGSTLELVNPVLGAVKVSMDPAVLLDFNPTKLTIDDWESNF